MSMFLPEGGQPSPGTSSITPAGAQTSQEDVALMQRVLGAAAAAPNQIPTSLLAYILDWIQTNNLIIPISQVFGFSQFTALSAVSVHTNEATASTSFDNLATVGPELLGLADGNYIVAFGAACYGSAANVGAVLAPELAGVTAQENDRAISTATTAVSVARIITAQLTNGSNDIVMKYHVDTALQTANFLDRWLIALRYANL